MCGIAGIVALDGSQTRPDQLQAMADSMRHRGPDDHGIFVQDNIALVHTRLSIIDLSAAGHQPMLSRCGRYVLTFNGEIYNFQEIAKRLAGVPFRGHSDSEVLLEALIRFGPEILVELNGMFALGFYDAKEHTLLIARDRFGIKPLFCASGDGKFRFASEIDTLFRGGLTDRRMRTGVIHEYLYYGATLGTATLYQAIDRLAPGHARVIDTRTGASREFRFAPLPVTRDGLQRSADDQAASVFQLLDDSVKRHLISDVPVAVFLSGGIDSSAITALAAKHSDGSLVTYSAGFDVPGGVDELPAARRVASLFETDHRELHVNVENVQNVLEKLTDRHGLPFGDAANVPLYLLSEEIRGDIKVVLQGDGGDEIFAGYPRYRWLHHARLIRGFARLWQLVPRSVRSDGRLRRINRVLDAFSHDDSRLMALLLTEETTASSPVSILSDEFLAEISASDPFSRYVVVHDSLDAESLVQRMLHVDSQIILPDVFLEKVDRSTMAHGIEVRVPFLDVELTDHVMGLPADAKLLRGQQKGLLKLAMRGLVPDDILDRPKTGFSVPYKQWLAGSLGDWLQELVSDGSVQRTRLFNVDAITSLLQQHRSGHGNFGFLLYKTLVMALWIERSEATL